MINNSKIFCFVWSLKSTPIKLSSFIKNCNNPFLDKGESTFSWSKLIWANKNNFFPSELTGYILSGDHYGNPPILLSNMPAVLDSFLIE